MTEMKGEKRKKKREREGCVYRVCLPARHLRAPARALKFGAGPQPVSPTCSSETQAPRDEQVNRRCLLISFQW